MSEEKPLADRIALVAGASRGAGRGIAVALGDAGATVYVTGRTTRETRKPADGAPGTIDDTADEVTLRGGTGIAVPVDHTDDEQVDALIRRIEKDHGHLDVLANAVWGGNEIFAKLNWGEPFWKQPAEAWDLMMGAGVRAYLTTSRYAADLMAKSGGGLVVHVTDGIDEKGDFYRGQIHWDLAHEAINRMVFGMSQDGKPAGIAVVALNPGFMRTERVLMHLKTEAMKKQFGFDRSESPEYIGRAVAALAADSDRMKKSGKLLWVADLADEYGFTDVDGKFVPRFDPFG